MKLFTGSIVCASCCSYIAVRRIVCGGCLSRSSKKVARARIFFPFWSVCCAATAVCAVRRTGTVWTPFFLFFLFFFTKKKSEETDTIVVIIDDDTNTDLIPGIAFFLSLSAAECCSGAAAVTCCCLLLVLLLLFDSSSSSQQRATSDGQQPLWAGCLPAFALLCFNLYTLRWLFSGLLKMKN